MASRRRPPTSLSAVSLNWTTPRFAARSNARNEEKPPVPPERMTNARPFSVDKISQSPAVCSCVCAKTGVIEAIAHAKLTFEVTHHVGQGCPHAARAGQVDTDVPRSGGPAVGKVAFGNTDGKRARDDEGVVHPEGWSSRSRSNVSKSLPLRLARA
jgi:hypothetical protein